MQYLHPVTGKNRLPMFVLILVGGLAAALLLNLLSLQFANRTIHNAFAMVIANVSEKYPQAEEKVIEDLRATDPASIARGRDILRQYGLDEKGVQDNMVGYALVSRLLPGSILLVLLVTAAFAALHISDQRVVYAQIAELTNYLQRLEQGDYRLDVRDSGESGFSLLKNELYKITVRLREQAELLKRDKVFLSDAIADISHQIKTPLTSLSVLVDLLADDPAEKDRREFVSRMRPQLGRIQWLITALLKLSRLDAGTANLKREPVNIKRLLEQALEPLRIPIELNKLQLIVQGDDQASFDGDFLWSAEALTNLIKNCVEHTPEGGCIDIRYTVNPLYVEITVADTGEGIASEDLPRIFQRFYRGKNASEHSIGIGLALAKAIFIEQGGDITVSSQPGQGTRFSVKVFHGVH